MSSCFLHFHRNEVTSSAINSSTASVVSANVHHQIESQLGQDTTAVHQLRSLLYSTERQLPMLKLSADTAVASSHVRLLGTDISLDLSFDRHISRVCVGCFCRLRQPRRTRRSLDSDSLATLIYAVVNSRMDYCHSVLAGAPRTVTDSLQRVWNAAVRVITGTRKFDRGVGQILHDQLHWLVVPDRVLFKFTLTVHQCLNGRAPPYLSQHCTPVSNADTRRYLRSNNCHLLAVPRFQLNTYGRRALSVVGPMAWNSLPKF